MRFLTRVLATAAILAAVRGVRAEPPPDDLTRLRAEAKRAEAAEDWGSLRAAWVGLEAAYAADVDLPRLAQVRVNLGLLAARIGDLREARDRLASGLETARAAKAVRLEATALSESAALAERRGSLAEALRAAAEAVALWRRMAPPSPADLAEALGRLGNVRDALGDGEQALAHHDEALALAKRGEDRVGEAMLRLNRANSLGRLGRRDDARAEFEAARAVFQEAGERQGVAIALGNLAEVEEQGGRHAEAMALREQALPLLEAEHDRFGIAEALGNMADIRESAGDLDGARDLRGRALAAAEEVGAADLVRHHLTKRAALSLRGAEERLRVAASADVSAALREAVALADRALTLQSDLLRGLAEGSNATARGERADAWGAGFRASIRLGDVPGAFRFLERGRAVALLESLSRAGDDAEVPAEIREAVSRAHAEEATSAAALRRAEEGGVVAEVRAAVAALDAARGRLRQAIERAQLQARAALKRPLPPPVEWADLPNLVADDEAFVSYAFLPGTVRAFVAAKDGSRAVDLGEPGPILAAVAALDASRAGVPATEVLAAADALGRLILDPLRLPRGAKRLLLCPDDAIGQVPFALLAQRRETVIVCVPSATVLFVLRASESVPGRGVLALGDPDYGAAVASVGETTRSIYRGARLVPLPKSREEVEAIASSADDVALLGKDATEGGLRRALAAHPARRWRALHFACHGLAREGTPLLSALALTPTADDDGFLTALEASDLRLSSDLVVLSACESAKGAQVRSEGTLGFVRAFLVAGASRVLASLWKVDDEATGALMKAFYERWRRGAGAADALRAAQDRVRSEERWAHPSYWAAWTLWGLSR